MTISTRVLLDAKPEGWAQHRFGAPAPRWKRLENKTIWVIGAGTGYGRAVSVALAAAGACLRLSGRRVERLRETTEEIRRHAISTERIELMPLDVTCPKQLRQGAQQLMRESSPLYGLVYCAALPSLPVEASPLLTGNEAYARQLIETNALAAWHATRAVWPCFLKGAEARAVYFSSAAGWAFTPGFGAYNASKALLNHLVGSLAAEGKAAYTDFDSQLNVLDPGEAKTEMNANGTASAYAAVSMTLCLLSCPPDGPTGCFFHRDGRHLSWASSQLHGKPVW